MFIALIFRITNHRYSTYFSLTNSKNHNWSR